MSYDLATFIGECTTILDNYTGDLPTANATRHFHQQHMTSLEALDLLRHDEFRLCLPAALEGYPHGKRFTVSLGNLMRIFAGHEHEKSPQHSRHLRWVAEVFSSQELEVEFCSEATEEAIREKNAAAREMRELMEPRSRMVTGFDEALLLMQDLFWSTTAFNYPPGMLSEIGAGVMGIPTGLLLHLVASSVEDEDPHLSSAVREFADMHYTGELWVEFALADRTNVHIAEISYLDPAAAAHLLKGSSDAFRPLPGSIKLSYYADDRIHSPAGEAGYPLKVYVSEIDVDDTYGNCILISPVAAFAASATIEPAFGTDHKQIV